MTAANFCLAMRLVFYVFLILVLSSEVLCVPSDCPPFCSCRVLQHVANCRNGKLERIPWNLPGPTELLELDMKNNHIQVLTSPMILFPNLEIFDLSYNEIEVIGENIFASLSKLKRLLLRGNQLQQLPLDVFRGLLSMQVLDLSSNKLETIDEEVFSDLVHLEKLVLANNRLGRLERNTFRNLTNLQHLALGDNFLQQFPSLEGLIKLNSIYMDMNQIKVIPSNVLESALNVEVLSLNGNFISRIEVDAFVERSGECIHLERLHLRNNLLVHVPQIGCLKDLQELDLSGNLMQSFTDSDFNGLTRLSTLVLSNMPRLKTIRNATFSANLALRELTIASNPLLSSIEPGSLATVNGLRRLDLHGNSLKSLSFLDVNWDSLDFLDLRFNQWMCDCQLLWLHRKIEMIGRNETRFQLLEVQCLLPPRFALRRLIDLSEAELICVPNKTAEQLQHDAEDKILFGLLGGTCSILFVVMICVLLKFRNSFLNPSSGTYPYAAYIHPSFRNPDIHPIRESQSVQRLKLIQANQEISQPHKPSEYLTRESVIRAKERKQEVQFSLDGAVSA